MEHATDEPSSRTIAVIDDEQPVLAGTTSLLRSLGYQCVLFDSADAVDEHALERVDIVCSDVQMPGSSGLDLARRLAGVAGTPPVILVTGYPTSEVRAEAARIGVSALLEKPLDADALDAAIADALRKRRDRKADGA